MVTEATDFTMNTDTRQVSDGLYLFITSGRRLGVSVDRYGESHAATYLTPDEWRTLRAEGNRLVAMIEVEEGV